MRSLVTAGTIVVGIGLMLEGYWGAQFIALYSRLVPGARPAEEVVDDA